MQSKGNAPTEAHKRWREAVRELGCMSCGTHSQIEIHHPAGVTAKHMKVPIGHWWLVPLCHTHHTRLTASVDDLCVITIGWPLVGRWDFEKLMFRRVMQRLLHHPDGPNLLEVDAIYDFRR